MNIIEKQYLILKRKLFQLGFIASGSINIVYHKCGRKYCPCKEDKSKLHGPYYLWTWKEKGKTISKKLSEEQVKKCKKFIHNKKNFDRMIGEMKKITIEYILSIK